jgi:hypothetical protein
MRFASDSNTGLIVSKSLLRISERRYLPTARTQLSDMKFYKISTSTLIAGVRPTFLLAMPWQMTSGKSSAKALLVKLDGDSRSTAFSARTDD